MNNGRVAFAFRELRVDVAEHAMAAGSARYRNSCAITFRELRVTPRPIQLDTGIQQTFLRCRQCLANGVPDGLIIGCDAARRVDRVIRIEGNSVDAINVARAL